MSECCRCGLSLNESQYGLDDHGHRCKTCPGCSQRVGYHVFYRLEEFGMRDMGDGRGEIIQSYCRPCRSHSEDYLAPAFTCEKLST